MDLEPLFHSIHTCVEVPLKSSGALHSNYASHSSEMDIIWNADVLIAENVYFCIRCYKGHMLGFEGKCVCIVLRTEPRVSPLASQIGLFLPFAWNTNMCPSQF